MDTQNKNPPMLQVSETDKFLSTSVEPAKKSPSKRDKRYLKDEQKREKKEKERKGKLIEKEVDGQNRSEADNWPRVLVVTSPEENNVPIILYAMHKAIEGITGTKSNKITRAKSGHYVVEVTSDTASRTLLNTTTLANQAVRITPHRSLNSSRGVISSRFLLGASDDDLLEDLKNQGVSKVKRILRNRRDPTNSIVITFNSPSPKHQVFVLNQAFDVKPYVALPIRCFKCQKFGHMKTRCSKTDICPKCSEAHPENECKASTMRCSNCHGEHASSDRQCPKYVELRAVLEISARKGVPIKEAKKEFHSQKNSSFSKTLQKPNPIQDSKKQEHQFDATPFVPDRLQSLEFALVEQNKQHKAEISNIKKTNKAEIAEINARISEQEKRHLAEINQRDELIMEKDQMIIHQEQQIAELNRLITKLVDEKKAAVATAAKLESEQTVTAAAAPPSSAAAAPPSAAVVSSAALSLSSENKISPTASQNTATAAPCVGNKPTPRKITKPMARPSSIKKDMLPRTNSVKRSRSSSPKRDEDRKTSRGRSLERWTGKRQRSGHVQKKTPSPTKDPANNKEASSPKGKDADPKLP